MAFLGSKWLCHPRLSLLGGPVGKFQESSGRGGGRFLTAKIACLGFQWGLIKPANEKNPKQTSHSKDGCKAGGEEAPFLGTRKGTVDSGHSARHCVLPCIGPGRAGGTGVNRVERSPNESGLCQVVIKSLVLCLTWKEGEVLS